jgi:acyl carrier protein
MGLDAVEIILRTEDEFSISISDDEAASVVTVGDFYKVVLSKLDLTPGCLTSKAFYLTRRALVESLDLPRRSIRPASRLSPLLPDESRQVQWPRIRECLGMAIPPLRIPHDLKQNLYMSAFFTSSAIAIALCVFALWLGWSATPVFILSAILWVPLCVGGVSVAEKLATRRLATELPADTAGELARVILSLNYSHFAPSPDPSRPTDEDVWRRVVDIICDQMQIPREEIVPNASFTHDLGVS